MFKTKLVATENTDAESVARAIEERACAAGVPRETAAFLRSEVAETLNLFLTSARIASHGKTTFRASRSLMSDEYRVDIEFSKDIKLRYYQRILRFFGLDR